MRWLRIGLYTLAGAVAILLAAVAVLVSVDLGQFKDRIEELATNQLGRELRIDGELHVRVGTSFELYAEDVFLANPAWADDDPIFEYVETQNVQIVPAVQAVQLIVTTEDGTGSGAILFMRNVPDGCNAVTPDFKAEFDAAFGRFVESIQTAN